MSQPFLTTGFMLASTLLGHFCVKQQKHENQIPSERKTIVSAPGKVLITGGYLVLDPNYSGLVLSTSSRFYTTITESEVYSATTATLNYPLRTPLVIELNSPQFHFTTRYEFVKNSVDGSFELKSNSEKRNPYIENSILYALCVAEQAAGAKTENRRISIKLQADNDFYSQRQNLIDLGREVNLENLEALEKCYVCPDASKPIHKTGLGSSAAMVTSLTSALILHFTNLDSSNENVRELIHRVAQFCHCLAQGKIGSGFDVSAATFGSQRYKRFDTSILEPIMKQVDQSVMICSKTVAENIIQVVDPRVQNSVKWDNEHSTFELPPNFHLFVADVEQGSNTPSMVRCVLKWKSEKPTESNELWNSIRDLNSQVEEHFKILSKLAKEHSLEYEQTLEKLYQQPASEWKHVFSNASTHSIHHSIIESMLTIRTSFNDIRSKLKYMGEQAENVPIEPNPQTKLLNETMNANGCLIAGVPGAGGYDAVFSVLFAPNGEALKIVKTNVEQVWKNFKPTENDQDAQCRVTPLILNESKTKGIDVVFQ
ncbi:hypothetical protein C9374_000236 [Naegleria lovaniensis]|uniref:phosphomevalonate kinase n=1 Tax=Naegleria lovaniensis TaxID=51637 RepID=A0AA88KTR9_NAELO|nr:uncharacterized protein C9374_000236 [Naegleria lovaniensis]KAG2388797.1 hypothetical protein C9374_000236 [Naegleria lovaniensis]